MGRVWPLGYYAADVEEGNNTWSCVRSWQLSNGPGEYWILEIYWQSKHSNSTTQRGSLCSLAGVSISRWGASCQSSEAAQQGEVVKPSVHNRHHKDTLSDVFQAPRKSSSTHNTSPYTKDSSQTQSTGNHRTRTDYTLQIPLSRQVLR